MTGGDFVRTKKIRVAITAGVGMFLLSGCFQGAETIEEIDMPEDIPIIDETDENMNESEETNAEENDVDETAETTERTLYVFDKDGVVAPIQVEIPKIEGAAAQTVQYLVKEGPVTELLPEGFEAVLPEGTEVLGTNVTEDGTLIVDLSGQFANYEAEDEIRILEAMTHTLTQFEQVENIKLRMDGEDIDEMPVNGTPIANGYSKKHGINIHMDEKPHLQHSELVTIFYPKQHEEMTYFVPVSTYIDRTDDVFEAKVQKLLENIPRELGVQDVFQQEVSLEKAPELKEGVLQLVFNEYIFNDDELPIIQKDVMETLVRSLVDGEEVQAIDVQVEQLDEIMDEDGNVYNTPVQLSDFQQMEKM